MTIRQAKLKGFDDGFNGKPYANLENESVDVRYEYAKAFIIGSSL